MQVVKTKFFKNHLYFYTLPARHKEKTTVVRITFSMVFFSCSTFIPLQCPCG